MPANSVSHSRRDWLRVLFGELCSKGLGYAHIPNSKERAARAPKKTRDENRIDTETINGENVKVQRTDSIVLIGSSQVNNEECYQLVKMFRAMGAMSLDNQTRVCHANTPPAMSAAFGRGAMTNPWYDLKNTKLAWIEGSNLAECHPMGLKNLMKAKKNGFKIMHVDYFIQIRPGTDIAFLGAIINYVIQNRKYDMTTWQYQLDGAGKPKRSADTFGPQTVMSILKKHYERYTFEIVSHITGAGVADIKFAAELYSSVKPAVFMYVLGMTQHAVGVENIRCFTVWQLLRGNIGVPGGGIQVEAKQRHFPRKIFD